MHGLKIKIFKMSTALVSFCDLEETFYKNNDLAHRRPIPLDRRPLISPPLNVASARRNSASALSSIISPTAKPVVMSQKSTSNGIHVHTHSTIDVMDNSICYATKEHRKLDRSLSEPVAQPKLNQVNSSRYKTELCRPFEENGTCKYGDKCQFAHGFQELRTLARHPKYKTELCRTFHTTGLCPYGPRCHFIHNSEESRKHMFNNLQVGLHPFQRSEGSSGTSEAGLVANRPKTLSLGSFSLGSAGEISPPSSLSASPTSLNSFFPEDTLGNFSPAPHTAGAILTATAFSFSQDFTSLMSPVKQETTLSTFGGSQPSLHPVAAYTVNGLGDSIVDNTVFYEALNSPGHAPPSPVDSLSSELDSFSLGGSPRGATCSSPLDVSRNLPRLPIFSKLSILD
ncbi:mRNA decay activator protein ZFP36L1-like [Limulus polyphemus]|uniref:mRNA decay activator protein ZFP36L1-like n=1 Tax=Limulus polyphemus TaxID=6850 RepID=A0ABM1BGS0_LIMPO|nr:mRNA decay activator protein ZFP36L1-like [Limulus polyphemus]